MPDDNGNPQGWFIKYKLSTEELVQFLESKNVKIFTTYNYAHKEGAAKFINKWTYEFVKVHKNALPFGCVWPSDRDRVEYLENRCLCWILLMACRETLHLEYP